MISNEEYLEQIHELGFQLIEAKNNGQREVSIEDYELLLNAYIELFRMCVQSGELYESACRRYNELYNTIKPYFGL